MTNKEFNIKYKDYLEEGHYGLDINIPSVVEYLDEKVFPELINVPGFNYSQIKLKFNSSRFYCEPNSIESDYIESEINKLVKEFDSIIKTGI